MNYTDFSKTGGFPLDTDVLNFNNKALADGMKWPSVNPDGTTEEILVLSGCGFYVNVPGYADGFQDGWMLLNGEPIPFVDGTTSLLGRDGTLYLVETKEQATFGNGATYNVLEVTRYLTMSPTNGGINTGYNIYNVPRLESILGQRAAALEGWEEVILAPAFGFIQSAKLNFRRNLLTRQVFMRGEIVVINAQTISSPAIRYGLGSFPAKFAPAFPHHFSAGCDYHSGAGLDDPAIRSIKCKLNNSNNDPALAVIDFSCSLVRPSTALTDYTLRFSTSYLLD